MDFPELEELGLNRNERKVYTTLIEFGTLSAGEVSSKSQVPYGKIYTVLHSLTSKGLVSVVPEKTKRFTPSDPEALTHLIEGKEKVLRDAREKLKDLKKFYDIKEKNPVRMGIGRKAFHEIATGMQKTEKYSYSIRWKSEYKPVWVESSKKSLKRGNDIKNLARYDEETEKDVQKWIKFNKNFRKFENEGVAMSIVDNKEVMISLIKSNVTLLIKDEPFADVMRRMFLATYEQADKIK